MVNMMDPGFVALHSQHSLQHADWMKIADLAKAENVGKCFDSWNFEEFLGLTVYLFVTTQSQHTREQLSQILPKFGSTAVLPLLKILLKKEVFAEKAIPTLAQQSLNNMTAYALVIGANQVLDLKFQDDLKAIALEVLQQLLQSCEPSTNLVLAQLLSDTNRQLVSQSSTSTLSKRTTKRHSEVAELNHRTVQFV
ncbi:MAG: hypothetical protein AAF959_24015 [Cyanobacteria bacterium P01_D01_bin.56]